MLHFLLCLIVWVLVRMVSRTESSFTNGFFRCVAFVARAHQRRQEEETRSSIAIVCSPRGQSSSQQHRRGRSFRQRSTGCYGMLSPIGRSSKAAQPPPCMHPRVATVVLLDPQKKGSAKTRCRCFLFQRSTLPSHTRQSCTAGLLARINPPGVQSPRFTLSKAPQPHPDQTDDDTCKRTTKAIQTQC